MKWIGIALAAALIGGAMPVALGQATNDARERGVDVREANSSVRGVVRAVDPRNRTVSVRPDPGSGGPNAERDVELRYDDSTVVEYQGKVYNNPQDIEVGDRVEARMTADGWRLVQRFVVLRNVWDDKDTRGAPAQTPQPRDERPGRADDRRDDDRRAEGTRYDGRLSALDTRRRSFQLIQRSREDFPVTFVYDEDTRVERDGQRMGVESLRNGDDIAVTAIAATRGLLATRIDLDDRRASGQPRPDSAGAPAAPVRGVIRKIDSRARVMELDTDGRGAGATARRATVQYDRMTTVEYNGQRYAVQNLEAGDEVDIAVSRNGDELIADRVVVVRAK